MFNGRLLFSSGIALYLGVKLESSCKTWKEPEISQPRDPIHLNCAGIYQPILHFANLSLLDNMVCTTIAVHLDVKLESSCKTW